MPGTFVPALEITGITTDGRPFGMAKDIKVFVDKGIPGDVADVQMVKSFHSDKTLATGKILGFVKKSPLRREPFCRHFLHCGGCQWQNISYADQLRFKQQQVEELFRKFDSSSYQMLPIVPSYQQRHFRNRVTFTFSNRRWMSPEELKDKNVIRQPAGGYVLKGNNDRIMNIEECFLTDELAVTIMKSLREFALSNGFSFYDVRHEKGFLRSLTIRFGDDKQIMGTIAFGENDPEKIKAIMGFLRDHHPQLTSLYYNILPFKDALRSAVPHIHFSGDKSITYKMEDLVFATGPASFYQTNSLQAQTLYKIAREFAQLTGNETVYDLYTGTGTIALFLSKKAAKVIGIDSSLKSIDDARNNAKRNDIRHVSFIADDIKDAFSQELRLQHGKPDVIITDPPRSGMQREVINKLNDSGAKRIVYISCNPRTQAYDLRHLSPDYKLVKSQPVDMFPQTSHVENVVLLERRNS